MRGGAVFSSTIGKCFNRANLSHRWIGPPNTEQAQYILYIDGMKTEKYMNVLRQRMKRKNTKYKS